MSNPASHLPQGRVAVIGLDDDSFSLLASCFARYHLTCVPLPLDSPKLAENFQAYVLPIEKQAGPTLKRLREAEAGYRRLIYGVASSANDLEEFARYAVNAILLRPLQEEAALNVIGQTHLMALGQFRRFLRMPLATAVHVRLGDRHFLGLSREIGGGGLCLATDQQVSISSCLEVTLTLPAGPRVHAEALVCWVRPEEHLVGLWFKESVGQKTIKVWVDDYLRRSGTATAYAANHLA